MITRYFIFLMFLVCTNFVHSQTKSEIKILLDEIGMIKNSRKIYKTKSAKKIISYGKNSLPILASFFSEPRITNVFSECYTKGEDGDTGEVKQINVNNYLTIGELAILIAHQLEYMMLTKITGTHNCAPISCKKFNSIESNLSFINEFGINKFKQKYLIWLDSNERKEWLIQTNQNSL